MKRISSLLLVFVLLLSVFPSAYAAEIADPTEPPVSDEEIVAATELTIETEPPESFEQESPTKSTEPTEDTLHPTLADSGFTSNVIEQSYVTVEDPGEYAFSTFSVKKTATLRNYDSMDFTTSDGLRQGFHYADEDGKAPWDYMNMIYCLEHTKSFSVGSGHAGVGELPLDGSGDTRAEKVWYSLSADQRVAIGLVLLYGAPTKLWDEKWGLNDADNRNTHNPNVGYRFATQVLVWEIADGWREATPPYELKNDYWYDCSIGQCTSEDRTVDHFLVGYNAILDDMRMHNVIPSFAGGFADTAPEILMTGNSITVTDSNKVLPKFDFTNTNTISYSKNGNDLTITATGAVPSAAQSATATLPDPAASLYEVWYNQYDSSKQACIKVSIPASDPVPAYFKLKASTGNLALNKTTEDSKNLGGWQFGIYADQACTSLLAGPVESDSNGVFSVNGLAPGTVWVKELGHNDTTINDLYYCESPNPQTVTVVAGKSTAVTFTNRIRSGSITVQKVDTTDSPRAGTEFLLEWSEDNITWQIVTCSDSPYVVKGGCTSVGLTDGKLVSGEDGMVLFEGLHPELYYRLTETKAPEGLQLLADYAYAGMLPIEKDLTVSLKVVNAPVFTLPKTGSNTAVLLYASFVVCIAACVGALIYPRRKEQ